jgi:hypothetical protein
MFLSQAYKSGVPRQLRNNLSMGIFFANKSCKVKEEVAEEMSAFISVEDFISMWDLSTEEPHGMFLIDFDSAKPEYRFRKNFDTLILSPEKRRQEDEGTAVDAVVLPSGKKGKGEKRADGVFPEEAQEDLESGGRARSKSGSGAIPKKATVRKTGAGGVRIPYRRRT